MSRCARCKEEVGEHPVWWKNRPYCCEACAFEDSKKLGSICGSRESLETSLRFQKKAAKTDKF